MTLQTLVLALAVGAALLALWLYLRFDSYAPGSIGRTFAHAAGAFLVLRFMPVAEHLVVAGSGNPLRKLAAVFLIVLPGLTYIWLVSIWLIKLAQRDTFRVR